MRRDTQTFNIRVCHSVRRQHWRCNFNYLPRQKILPDERQHLRSGLNHLKRCSRLKAHERKQLIAKTRFMIQLKILRDLGIPLYAYQFSKLRQY
jgi:hypothetical protein